MAKCFYGQVQPAAMLLTAASVLFTTHHLFVEAIEASRDFVAPPQLISYVASLGKAVSSDIFCFSVQQSWLAPAMITMPALTVTPFRCSYFPSILWDSCLTKAITIVREFGSHAVLCCAGTQHREQADDG